MFLDKQNSFKAIFFGIALTILLGFCLYLSNFLESNFAYQGESFFKGYGHILIEKPKQGLIFVIAVNLISPISIFYLFFLLLEKEVQVITYKILRIVAFLILTLTVSFVGIKLGDITNYMLTGNERLVEIIFTWPLRVLGFLLGYQLIKLTKLM